MVELDHIVLEEKTFKEKSRISKKNLFFDVDEIEALDIDTEFDFFSRREFGKKIYRIKFD